MSTFRDQVQSELLALRERILEGLQALEGEGRTFARKAWQKPPEAPLQGRGEMAELRGELFEKGGVNFSAVSGRSYPVPPAAVGAAQREGAVGADGVDSAADAQLGLRPPSPSELAGKPFFATGVSLVMHPRSPYVPIVHFNVRYLEVGEQAWFGGGLDLTPCKRFDEDTAHFHGVLKEACDRRDPRLHPRLSGWARDYFFLPHRGSERGVGGIFFDYLHSDDPAADFAFVRDVGASFLPAYAPIVERRRGLVASAADRDEQLRWRGRYVEFNLLYDRGTLFGLKSGGDPEAIFMSLPPLVSW